MKRIETSTPTRIDLAGGTIDIWPLYLMLEGSSTVNITIDLRAKSIIEERSDNKVSLISKDRNMVLDFNSCDEIYSKSDLELAKMSLPLHLLIAKTLNIRGGFNIITEAKSYAGAGLGGSSALGLAILAGAVKFTGQENEIPNSKFVHLIRDIETKVLGIPAGVQDYYSAFTGGLNRISFSAHGEKVQHYSEDKFKFIKDHMVLLFTGKSRNSGINNWAVFKGFLDKDENLMKCLNEISSSASDMNDAIEAKDINKIAKAMNRDWQARRIMADVSNDFIDSIFKKAVAAGAVAGKVCGAGGGGCMVLMVENESAKTKVKQAVLEVAGVEILDFVADSIGLTLN